jgi:tetratricopeptide (TPR) repeat protein
MSAGAEVCDLCGTPVDGVERVERVEAPERGPAAVENADPAPTGNSGTGCDTCGQENPPGSRYCNRCGTRLAASAAQGPARTPVIPPDEEQGPSDAASGVYKPFDDTDRAVGKQVMLVVSAALLLVVVLYAVTAMSGGSGGSFDAAPAETAADVNEPLASQWADREAELKADIDGSSGDAQLEARRRLIDLYFAADRLDLAAEQTGLIAEATQSEEEWILAGNLYFDWMQRADETRKAVWARQAVAAYQAALEMNPSNLDVRTDMAIAYLYDPQNSMMAIQETNRVLAEDSFHIQANFNRGIMLTQIDRVDQAIEQFERVKTIIGDPADPVYQRAVDAIARLSGS